MKALALFAISAMLSGFGMTNSAKAETVDCSVAVDRAHDDLDAAGLRQIIAKPSQNFVSKSGIVYTGAQVNFLRREFGLARDACRRGDGSASLDELQKMYAALNPKD